MLSAVRSYNFVVLGDSCAAIWEDMDKLEEEISRYVPYSDLSQINGSPAGKEIIVREAAMDILSFGKEVWEQTGGAFDLTIGPLAKVLVWPNGFAREVTQEDSAGCHPAANKCLGKAVRKGMLNAMGIPP